MARSIWKFPLELLDKQVINMPKNSDILAVQVQNGVICLWAMVDPFVEKVPKAFHIVCTGRRVGQDIEGGYASYLGTVQMDQFVWHIFEG
jgi:hypothetical protein